MANIQAGNVTAADVKNISPAERNANFTRMTRQFWQAEPVQTGQAGTSVTFDLTKVRLTSKIRVLVEAELTVTHASATTYEPHPFAPFNLIRNVRVDINNGFSPFICSGTDLYIYNYIRPDAFQLERKESGRGKVVQGSKSSSAGAKNKISFMADMPFSLNDRDPMGMVMTANQATTVSVTIDFADANVLGSGQAGYTMALSNIKVSPMVESFAIPPTPVAVPDTTIIKLVQSTKQAITSAGQQIVKLTTGYTYRKLAFYITDANGKGVADDELTGYIELILNQADRPYRLTASQLAKINHEQFGYPLPQGVFVLDFSYQGISGLGGTRDYIDTERLTEFWLSFNAANAGNVHVVYEQLSLLR